MASITPTRLFLCILALAAAFGFIGADAQAHHPGVPADLRVAASEALGLTGAARAAEANRYPGQRSTNDPMVLAMRDRAAAWLRAKGHTVPANVPVDVATSLEEPGEEGVGMTAGRAWNKAAHGEDRIAILADEVGVANALTRKAARKIKNRSKWRERVRLARIYRAAVQQVILHEMGHVAGLALYWWNGSEWIDGHPASGFMSNSNPSYPGWTVADQVAAVPMPTRRSR